MEILWGCLFETFINDFHGNLEKNFNLCFMEKKIGFTFKMPSWWWNCRHTRFKLMNSCILKITLAFKKRLVHQKEEKEISLGIYQLSNKGARVNN